MQFWIVIACCLAFLFLLPILYFAFGYKDYYSFDEYLLASVVGFTAVGMVFGHTLVVFPLYVVSVSVFLLVLFLGIAWVALILKVYK
jgi:uncharacterized membrane protein